MKISGWAAKTKGSLLERFTYERNLSPHELLVDIKFCSLTRGDVRFIDNYWGDIIYPFIPGLEIIGEVKEKGKDVLSIKIGDVVGVGYQVGSCFKCYYCLAGKEQFCLSQKLIPVNEYGGIADSIIVDCRFAFKLPKNLRTPASTPLLCAGLTPFAAIKKAEVKKGMNVAVIGIGSLGHLALQFLNKMDCKVTVFSHSKSKNNLLKKLGANTIISSKNDDDIKKFERKFDFIISTSSASLNWELFIKALKPEGIFCFVGLPPDKVSFKAELLADYAQKKIMGNYIGSRKDMKDMLDFASKHNIQAVVETFPMNQVNQAIEKMKNNIPLFSVVLIND